MAVSEFGLHGYDNEAIGKHPFFFANGPAFMPECKLKPFNNLDLFPLFCEILDLQCLVGNGTKSHLTKCLKKHQQFIIEAVHQLIPTATRVFVVMGTVTKIFIMALMMRRRIPKVLCKRYYSVDG